MQMSVQKAIFPGLVFGILCLVAFTNMLLEKPGTGRVIQGSGSQASLAGSSNSVDANLAQNSVMSAAIQKAESSAGDCSISRLYPDSIQQWCQIIERYARDNGLDPNLVSAVMLRESAGRPDALSKSGAVGLMQVMPRDGKAASFMCKNGPCFTDRPSSDELYDPEFNVAYATRMLADLIGHYGSIREALRAYGPMDVGYYYADLVLSTMNKHR